MLRAWMIAAVVVVLGCGGVEAPVEQPSLQSGDSSTSARESAVSHEPPRWVEPPPLTSPEVYPAARLERVDTDEGSDLYDKEFELTLADGPAQMTYLEYLDRFSYYPAVRKDSLWQKLEQHPFFERVVPGASFYVTPENKLVASLGERLYFMDSDLNFLLEDCGCEFLPDELSGWVRLDVLLKIMLRNLRGGFWHADVPPDPVLPEVEITRVVYIEVPPDVNDNPYFIPPGFPYLIQVHYRLPGVCDSMWVLTAAARKDGKLRLFPRGGDLPPPRLIWEGEN
ncbi:hypothetical protein JXB37_08355 [candidate division WOR-3 bacterium]|nr:hypothetical protein [candidate division WOR-3 bacterium]